MRSRRGAARFTLVCAALAGLILAGCFADLYDRGTDGPGNSSGPADLEGSSIAAAAAGWLLSQADFSLSGPLLVMDAWDDERYRAFTDEDGHTGPGRSAVVDATPTSIAGSMDAATRETLEEMLTDRGSVEFVPSIEAAEDRAAPAHFGCYPFRGDGTLIILGAPLRPAGQAEADNSRLVLHASVSRACSGAVWILALTWDGSRYSAVVVDGYMYAV